MALSTLEIVLYLKKYTYLHYWKAAIILLKICHPFLEIKYSQAMSKEIVLHCPHKNICSQSVCSTIDFIIFIFDK